MRSARAKVRRMAVAVAAFSAGMGGAGTVIAQPNVLEEIVVTAQFREQSLQDVPVSVSAISGDKLFESGIDRIEDLQAYVPNLTMSETGIGTNIYIRGIGSGINQGFEQSVGMYVDGVYYGRAQLSRAPFLDLERVEVLRGPQNILYGKNSIAGALNISTRRPGDEFEGMVSVLHEPKHNEQVYDLVLSGPVTETLGARFAFRKRNMDGYIRNLTLGQDEPRRDERTGRLILDWRPSEDVDVMLKYERSTFDVKGRQIEIINDEPSTNPLLGGLNYSEILVNSFGQDPSVLNNRQDFRRSSNGDRSDNDVENVTLNVNVALGDHTLTFISGYLNYDYDEHCDCDFTGANLFTLRSQENFKQFSQEIRLVSPAGQTFEYITGAYFQRSDLDFRDNFVVPTGSVIPPVVGNVVDSDPGIPISGAAAAAAFANLAVPRWFEQDTRLWSVFGQVTWNVTDQFRVSGGVRYSDEKKNGSRELVFTGMDGSPLDALNLQILDALMPGLFAVQQHELRDSRRKKKFSPQLGVEFDFNEDVLLYASFTEGHKSGGFDARSNSAPASVLAGSFEYDDEKARNFEIGAKTRLLGGRAELNVAAFYTEYKDLQVSIYDGVFGFNVGNAAEAEAYGVEIDGRFRVNSYLTLVGSLAWLDFEFKDYPNGQCVQGQTPDAPDGVNCNYKGKTNQYVADWSGNISALFQAPLSENIEFRGNIDLIYTDDYHPSQNLDNRVRQDGYTRVNARLAIAGMNSGWELALVGRNLTNEKIVSYASDTPLAHRLFDTVSHYGMIERDRSIALQGIYRW